MSNGFLSKAYQSQDARQLYDDWAASYDAEVGENGYATPGRCATALRAQMADPTLPILDFGCGTGLSGLALRLAGFTNIDGLDLSAEMLEQAAKKSLYRSLTQVEAGQRLSHTPGTYAAICAIGVIGTGAAPISVFDILMGGLAPGGLLVFSFNDHALRDPVHEAKLQSYLTTDRAQILFQEYGDHLPGQNLNSTVYIIEKN
jgi:predicted TPR repeat methyltransferase